MRVCVVCVWCVCVCVCVCLSVWLFISVYEYVYLYLCPSISKSFFFCPVRLLHQQHHSFHSFPFFLSFLPLLSSTELSFISPLPNYSHTVTISVYLMKVLAVFPFLSFLPFLSSSPIFHRAVLHFTTPKLLSHCGNFRLSHEGVGREISTGFLREENDMSVDRQNCEQRCQDPR